MVSIKRLINQVTPIGSIGTEGLILPNHSGDHSAGILRETPLQDSDIVNKKYVDDNFEPIFTLDDKKIVFGDLEQDTNLVWDKTNERLGVGEPDPDTIVHLKGDQPHVRLESSSSYATPPQATIQSRLKYTSSGITQMTGIEFAKENAVSGNTGGVMKFIGKKAGATAAECMRINSTGTLVFTQAGAGLPYAELYVNDNSTAKTIATGNTYVKMDGTLSNGSSSNCTADGTNAKITITKAGIYRINARFNGMIDTANTEVEGAIFLDGSVQSNLVCKAEFVAVNKNCSSAISGLIDCPANKDIDFRVRHNDGGSVDLTIVDANISVVMVGGT